MKNGLRSSEVQELEGNDSWPQLEPQQLQRWTVSATPSLHGTPWLVNLLTFELEALMFRGC